MSSSSSSDEENTMQKTNNELKENENNETKLESDLKSLQTKYTYKEDISTTTEEGITVKKISSTHKLSYEESVRNKDRPELSSILTADESTSGADASNWRSSRTHSLREKKEYTSVSQPQSWRDTNFKYERCKQNDTSACSSRKWRSDGTRENRSCSFEDKLAYLPTFAKNRDRSKMGNWTFSCAPDIVLDNGLTEVEHVRNCVNELYEQNGELFATRRPSEFNTRMGEVKINCYTSNYEDKVHVAKVADILIKKIKHYPYCFFYFYDRNPLYMRTCEKELYEFTENNWKLIDFDE